MIDGGPGAEPSGRLDAWLVTDEQAELIGKIRRAAGTRQLGVHVGTFRKRGLCIEARPVIHTSHPAYGYRIEAGGHVVVWAPEFYRFPRWARRADLMFAEASGWARPIRFPGGVGGHASVLAVAKAAKRSNVRRLVFAHIGRPTLKAIGHGATAPFGEFAADGQIFVIRREMPRRRRPR
jgi:hypothetical protein